MLILVFGWFISYDLFSYRSFELVERLRFSTIYLMLTNGFYWTTHISFISYYPDAYVLIQEMVAMVELYDWLQLGFVG